MTAAALELFMLKLDKKNFEIKVSIACSSRNGECIFMKLGVCDVIMT